MERELLRIETGSTSLKGGIDLSRYTDLQDGKSLKTQQTYVALGYTLSRQENLSLMGEFGKNQWLIGNDQLEKSLKELELELQEQKKAIEVVNNERKRKQLEAQPTLTYLESRWRDGIKGLVDVNLACLKLERDLKRSRGE
jgi:hypothetical protein